MKIYSSGDNSREAFIPHASRVVWNPEEYLKPGKDENESSKKKRIHDHLSKAIKQQGTTLSSSCPLHFVRY